MSSFTAEQIDQDRLEHYIDRCQEAETKLKQLTQMITIGGEVLLAANEEKIPRGFVQAYVNALLDIINEGETA